MRSDDVILIFALDMKMLSWFDLRLCTNYTLILNRDYWYKGKSFKQGCRCIAAAGLPPTIDFETACTPFTRVNQVHTEAPSVAVTKEVYSAADVVR